MSWSSDRNHSERLSDLPPWGLEIMMGLYGPDTIAAALEAERTSTPQAVDRSVAVLSAVGFVPVYLPPAAIEPHPATQAPQRAQPMGEFGTAHCDPAMAEFAAIDALGRKLARLFRRR